MSSLLLSIPSPCRGTVQSASYHSVVDYVRPRLPAAALTMLVMLALKRHYSLATADELNWVLAPTAMLVRWLTSANPVLEDGIGYADFANGIIVAPACAGVNFMIMAFGLAAFCGLHYMARQTNKLAWLVLALSAAYCLTLVVNTIRIAFSMALYRADIYTDWLTVSRVHRMAGVGLYFGVLWLYFLGLRQIMRHYCRHSDRQPRRRSIQLTGWPALGCYLLVSIGLPLANRAWQNGLPLFVEHCATVVLASLAVWAVAAVMSRLSTVLCRCVPT